MRNFCIMVVAVLFLSGIGCGKRKQDSGRPEAKSPPSSTDTMRQAAARREIAIFVQALDEFYIHTGVHPSTEEGLKALVEPPMDATVAANWDGPYLRKRTIPPDPWKRPYVYRQPGRDGTEYDIICYGKDGVEGGEGLDADISNHNLSEM